MSKELIELKGTIGTVSTIPQIGAILWIVRTNDKPITVHVPATQLSEYRPQPGDTVAVYGKPASTQFTYKAASLRVIRKNGEAPTWPNWRYRRST